MYYHYGKWKFFVFFSEGPLSEVQVHECTFNVLNMASIEACLATPLTIGRPLDDGSCSVDPEDNKGWFPFGPVECPHIGVTILDR